MTKVFWIVAILLTIIFVLWYFYPRLFCKCDHYANLYVPPNKKLIIQQGQAAVVKSKSNITNN